MKKCVVCIGSNYNRKESLAFARRKLMELFSPVCFSVEQETLPVNIKNRSLFSNQVAVFFSELKEEEVKVELRKIEEAAGRSFENNKKGIIVLDIDLLLFHHRILKPEDMKREYILKGIEEIMNSETYRML
ncbi:putative 2-amino-4-hydroxy-6-hydroxymethyldihydropteridine diphosphokinase [Bacteroides pyogenes F0041]|uniref:2-amino-4-hydroxy-6-hydroxymethyldihydropteridine pyrophosphokinase n=1 Tax=Bacteroides pyogenes F0041 TaxID=1321819 RepID=U2CNZ8_9BACE|nr:2-amino-4-hydroxy-6-hydroxymethyldihydropteridine diphosphokinase [Bacteroides pyogenes]ERI85788.1 putative 2-amino-4-hydroxy-6-hydroxymethyldihydropteridine diphosphokinase [Bacteroides pyogenes F0041]MBB3895567.1 2-amino-4-hydroxy-6-hydroxymethyldihydropteridine diphosphokinase [Bacteroides pyogenes]SUV34577.1 2-amino-4-hydroxy-6-hydroxymethyldihydropteridinepyrophosphokinase [Bacteroides pyogenes]